MSNQEEVELAKLTLENHKLQLEREKLAVEKRSASITAVAIFIPLLIAAVSFASSVHTQNRQAKIDFRLKAADVVLNSNGPTEAQNRAFVLQRLFPDQLSTDFGLNLNPSDYGEPSIELRRELARLLIDHPERRDEIIGLWKNLFGSSQEWQELLDSLD